MSIEKHVDMRRGESVWCFLNLIVQVGLIPGVQVIQTGHYQVFSTSNWN